MPHYQRIGPGRQVITPDPAGNADAHCRMGIVTRPETSSTRCWPTDPIHNNVNTRAELIEYDSALAELVEEVYGDASAPSSCHQTLDVSYNSVEDVVLDPHGQPVEWALLWFGSEANPDRTSDVTGADGSFIARVPNGSYTIEVHADPPGECSFVGWYGHGGFTTRPNQIIRVEVADQDVLGVQVTLSDELENLPYIEQCAI